MFGSGSLEGMDNIKEHLTHLEAVDYFNDNRDLFRDAGEYSAIPTKPCPQCSSIVWIIITQEAYDRYRSGALIQNAFPTMSHVLRERFLSGFCGPCWENIFS